MSGAEEEWGRGGASAVTAVNTTGIGQLNGTRAGQT